MSAGGTGSWWRRNRRPLGALILGLVAAGGMFTVVDVLPEVQAEGAVEFHTADSADETVSLGESSIGPVVSQFFPDDVVAFLNPPPGSQAMWVTVEVENAPANCTLRLTEVDGQRRTWLSAIPILAWEAPDDGPATCEFGRQGENYRLINAFALPPDAPGPFILDMVVNDYESLVVRVGRFTIAPTLAEG